MADELLSALRTILNSGWLKIRDLYLLKPSISLLQGNIIIALNVKLKIMLKTGKIV